jgi:hypothetical protein
MFIDFPSLKAALRAKEGIMTVAMEPLLALIGYEKAGSTGRELLKARLAEYKIGHIPADLPPTKYASIRLFDLDSSARNLFEAFNSLGESHDVTLRDLVAGDVREALRNIKKMVEAID